MPMRIQKVLDNPCEDMVYTKDFITHNQPVTAGTRDFNPNAKSGAQAKMLFSRSWKQTKFVILPPSKAPLPSFFRNVEISHKKHDSLLGSMQRLRGNAYVADGAIGREQLTADGRHVSAIDEHSWHVVALGPNGEATSCLRYFDESRAGAFENLMIRKAALAKCPQQGPRFRTAVEWVMRQARQMGMGFGEVGGWAVAESHRRTMEPVGILLATYGLLELLGGCVGVATATFRHASSTILRKIGLSSLTAGGVELEPYFDPSYGCQMEVLRFDSRFPSSKYAGWVTELAQILRDSPVICRNSVSSTLGLDWQLANNPAA